MTKQKLVSFFFQKNYMFPPDLLDKVPEELDFEIFVQNNPDFDRAESITILTEDLFAKFFQTESVEEAPTEIDVIKTSLEVINSYVDKPKKREVQDFVTHMKKRYHSLKKILLHRSDLQTAISISKAVAKQEKEPVAVIGFISEINETKNGNYILELEDPTGKIKVLISKKNEECMELVDELILDEVIGVIGIMGSDIIFSNAIIFPDIPMQEFKKAKDDVCVAFASDLHVGSHHFAEEEWARFIDWLNLRHGTEEQKKLARKVKYLVLSGDLIDGVGIYPNQEKELKITDIYGQYEKLAGYLDSLRDDIKIVCCGGNHDALRLAEPQPPLSKDFAKSIHAIKNMTVVSNPSVVRIHNMFDILIYHGYCFDYYMNNIDYIRNAGGYDASDIMMEFVLRKRHLGPVSISIGHIPDLDKDPRVIEQVPDFFVTGHIHHDVKIRNYKNVTLIGCCSFQYKTDFQEKLGHTNITWGKVPVINLKSRQITVMDFKSEK